MKCQDLFSLIKIYKIKTSSAAVVIGTIRTNISITIKLKGTIFSSCRIALGLGGDEYPGTPRPLYNTIVGVHSINRVS